MIGKLKEEIAVKLGQEITTRKDCEVLSEDIEIKTGKYLNYNTLRRFFGVDKNGVTPQTATLDVLSSYVGYQSYQHFTSFQPHKHSYEQHLQLYALISEYHKDSLVSYYQNLPDYGARKIDFLTQLCRHGLLAGKVGQLCEILDHLQIRPADFAYDEILIIGNSIGMILRDLSLNRPELKCLLENRFFEKFVFTIFIDYSSLNGYYAKFISQKASSIELSALKKGLKTLRKYLNEKPVTRPKGLVLKGDQMDWHPILLGRILSLGLYAGEATTEYFDSLRPLKIEHLYEPMVASIITSNFELFPLIKEEMGRLWNTRKFGHLHYFQVYFLFTACYWYQSGKPARAAAKLTEVDTADFRFSYKDLLCFYYYLLSYRLHNDHTARQEALLISQKLDYPLWSQSYIDGY